MKCENEKPNYTYMNNYTFGGGEMYKCTRGNIIDNKMRGSW